MPRIGYGGTEAIIQKLTVLYIIIWSISPPLQIDMVYRLAALGCAGIWAMMALRRGLQVYMTHVYAVLFAVAVVFIAYIEKGSFDAIMQQIAIYILVVCFVINVFYENRWKELSGIVPVVLILLIVFNWNTAKILLEDHTVARLLIRDDAESYQYLRQGIGGYSLIYPQVCISPAILAWILSAFQKHKLSFAIGCLWAYTYVLCILRAGYSIAIFVTVIGVVMLLFYKGKRVLPAVILSAVLFATALLVIVYVAPVRNYLLEYFDGTAIATKINDLMGTSEDANAEGSIEARLIRYSASVRNIIQYPFIGSLWMKSGGGHSAIIDTLSKYGLWGGSLYIIMLFSVPQFYKKRYANTSLLYVCNAVIVATLFAGILDSFTYSFMPMIMIISPLLFENLLRWKGIENENSLDCELNTSRSL